MAENTYEEQKWNHNKDMVKHLIYNLSYIHLQRSYLEQLKHL